MRFELIAFALAIAASSASAQVCVDQTYVPTTGNGLEVTNNQSVQQTFTAALSGQLVEVELHQLRHHRGVSTFDLRMDLVATAGGTPTANPLATAIIPPSAVSSFPATIVLDLRGYHVSLIAGETLAIHLETLSQSGGATYAWGGDAPGGYANGETWIRTNVGPLAYDMGFTTKVEKSPALMLDLAQPDGPRSIRLRNVGGIAGDFYLLALSFDPTNAPPSTGLGPWAGLFISTSDLIGELQVGFPFVGLFDAQGRSTASYPSPTVPGWVVGRNVWGVTRDFSPALAAFPADSPIEPLRLR